MTGSDSEGECQYDQLSRDLKAERGKRDDAPKRKRGASSPSSSSYSDGGPSSNKQRRRKKGQEKTRAPSSSTFTNDNSNDTVTATNKWMPRLTAADLNSMFTRYAAVRTSRNRERLRNMQPDQVACTHDQKVKNVWGEYKNTYNQLRRNATSARSTTSGTACGSIPSIPQHGWDEIEKARCDFFAANRGLQAAERRHLQAQRAEQRSLDAAKALIRARRASEESLRLALASTSPYRDLCRLRLSTTLRQSVADTQAIVSISKTVALSLASARAIAKAKVSLFELQKNACRSNREATVCRVNGTGDSSTSDGAVPLRLHRLTSRDMVTVALPPTTAALDEQEASIPNPGVSPRLRVVFSQLNAIDAAAAKNIADKRATTLERTKIAEKHASRRQRGRVNRSSQGPGSSAGTDARCKTRCGITA